MILVRFILAHLFKTVLNQKFMHRRNIIKLAPQALVGMPLQQNELLMNNVDSFHELLPAQQQHFQAASPTK